MMKKMMMGLVAGLCVAGASLYATETENLNSRVLPVPGKLTIDGTAEGWDLSGGVFVCGDVENQRDRMSVWIHTMYDKDNLYVLARFKDETPLSNPGSTAGDWGWEGDSLQLRIIIDPDNFKTPICWVTAWRDRDGKDVIDLAFPQGGGEALRDAKTKGARQAFSIDADGKGYIQEMALPWATLRSEPFTPQAGQKIVFSVEPNFNTSANYRISLKGIFRPGTPPDRVFTFTADRCWGIATLMPSGNVDPQPLRLADNREFKVTMEDGIPVIDWTGLFEVQEREGFTAIDFELPEDGYVSLNIKDASGFVVRQLLTAEFHTKGKHSVLWDGLTNMSHMKPGEIVAAGTYTWEAIYHTGVGLRLVGWADNAGKTPYDSPGGNWGGDHGDPNAVATDGESMYLGWNGSEAGKALVCTDFEGGVKWRHRRGGFGAANYITVLDGVVYAHDWQDGNVIFRVTADKGDYINFEGSDSAWVKVGEGMCGLDSRDGKLYLAQNGTVRILDAKTGKDIKNIPAPGIRNLKLAADGSIYIIADGKRVLKITEDGKSTVVVGQGLDNAVALEIGADGTLYVAVQDPDNQIKVFSKDGKLQRAIGKQGGRPLFGPWVKEGMRFANSICLDKNGVLWVAERDAAPKRFSCWKAADGSFAKEFFGPTAYGATGGAISPVDPQVMVGSGCEWQLDPVTGKSHVVGVFHRGPVHTSRIGRSPEGRLYVAVHGHMHGKTPVHIYERVAPGDYKYRTRLEAIGERTNEVGFPDGYIRRMRVWSDVNGDGIEQPEEVKEYAADLGSWISGWYMPMTSTMIFYGGRYRLEPVGWTACGAPIYDPTQSKRMPAPEDVVQRGGMGAPWNIGTGDGKYVIYNGHYGQAHTDFQCFDIYSGKLLWTYPNNYMGVHGGHSAPPQRLGMIRAAYDFAGTGKLPDPIGNFFVIGTDKGEWHILTASGFYLTSLFEADPLKIQFPDNAVPGAIMDNIPPGMGAEDFGGSIMVGDDGYLYLQAGKTAYINLRVIGLDSVKSLEGSSFKVSDDDLVLAAGFREKLMQASIGTRMAVAKKHTVSFTGDVRRDFGVNDVIAFQKTARDRVEAVIGYDDATLFLGWSVTDATPWINAASDPTEMYSKGDTVDFQFAMDTTADRQRADAVLGDFRISIGNLKGTPTAVLFRPMSDEKNPRTFFSGVRRDGYEVQYAKVIDSAQIAVKVADDGRGYVVQAAIPLKALGFTPVAGTSYLGDIGVTFGDQEGAKTILRSFWNNQKTGIVADDVFELMLEPRNWGQITFE